MMVLFDSRPCQTTGRQSISETTPQESNALRLSTGTDAPSTSCNRALRQPIHHPDLGRALAAACIQGIAVDAQLMIGAVAVSDDPAEPFELGEAAEVGSMFAEQPDQLLDQIRERDQLASAEVSELSLPAIALGAPLVLGQQDAPVLAPALIVAAQPIQEGEQRLVKRDQ